MAKKYYRPMLLVVDFSGINVWTTEEIEILNILITDKAIILVIRNLSEKKSPGPAGTPVNSTKGLEN